MLVSLWIRMNEWMNEWMNEYTRPALICVLMTVYCTCSCSPNTWPLSTPLSLYLSPFSSFPFCCCCRRFRRLCLFSSGPACRSMPLRRAIAAELCLWTAHEANNWNSGTRRQPELPHVVTYIHVNVGHLLAGALEIPACRPISVSVSVGSLAGSDLSGNLLLFWFRFFSVKNMHQGTQKTQTNIQRA